MNKNELITFVAQAYGQDPADVLSNTKRRPGTQIKANSMWEGSCSPAHPRRRVGIFIAKDNAELAVDGAIKRMTMDVSYPEAIVMLGNPGGLRAAQVVGYDDAPHGKAIADGLAVQPVLVPRPGFSKSAEPESPSQLINISALLEEHPNLILQGPPGTGKTSLALQYAESLILGSGFSFEQCRLTNVLQAASGDMNALLQDEDSNSHEKPVIWELVQLHANYSYEDFVRRVSPIGGDQGLEFIAQDGLLTQMSALAAARGDNRPVLLIIDEINRGDLGQVFGEFIFAIDPGHRGRSVALQIQQKGLASTVTAPPNLKLLGTMNTTDRSLALVDHAVRRRFRFVDVPASDDVILEYYGQSSTKAAVAKQFFDACNADLDDQHKIGHSYFMVDAGEDEEWVKRFARSVAHDVMPMIGEYEREGLRPSSPIELPGYVIVSNDQFGTETSIVEHVTSSLETNS